MADRSIETVDFTGLTEAEIEAALLRCGVIAVANIEGIPNLNAEQEKGIHSSFNACMFRDECRANKSEVETLRAQLSKKDEQIKVLREALETLLNGAGDYTAIRDKAREAIAQLEVK